MEIKRAVILTAKDHHEMFHSSSGTGGNPRASCSSVVFHFHGCKIPVLRGYNSNSLKSKLLPVLFIHPMYEFRHRTLLFLKNSTHSSTRYPFFVIPEGSHVWALKTLAFNGYSNATYAPPFCKEQQNNFIIPHKTIKGLTNFSYPKTIPYPQIALTKVFQRHPTWSTM
jgi:hypothetical protein